MKKFKKSIVEKIKRYGVVVGENVDILDSSIDRGHGYLIEIGNNVTITGSTILAHDASTKNFWDIPKWERSRLETMYLLELEVLFCRE